MPIRAPITPPTLHGVTRTGEPKGCAVNGVPVTRSGASGAVAVRSAVRASPASRQARPGRGNGLRIGIGPGGLETQVSLARAPSADPHPGVRHASGASKGPAAESGGPGMSPACRHPGPGRMSGSWNARRRSSVGFSVSGKARPGPRTPLHGTKKGRRRTSVPRFGTMRPCRTSARGQGAATRRSSADSGPCVAGRHDGGATVPDPAARRRTSTGGPEARGRPSARTAASAGMPREARRSSASPWARRARRRQGPWA